MFRNCSLGRTAAALLVLFVMLGGMLLVVAPAAGASNQETTAEPSTVSFTFVGEFKFLPFAEMEFEVLDPNGQSVLLVNQDENKEDWQLALAPGIYTVEARVDAGPLSVRMKSLEFDSQEYSQVTLNVQYMRFTEVVTIVTIGALALSVSRLIRRFLRLPGRSALSSVEQKKDSQQDKPAKRKKRARSVFGALVPIPWQGTGVMALDLCWEMWALIQVWGNEDNGIEVTSDAEDEAFKVLKEEVRRIEEQLEQEFADDPMATATMSLDEPSRWAIREAELRDSSCVFQLLNAANKSSNAEVKGRAQNVIDRYVEEFEPWKEK